MSTLNIEILELEENKENNKNTKEDLMQHLIDYLMDKKEYEKNDIELLKIVYETKN